MVEQIHKGKSNDSNRGENLQNLFFSKDCISGLNKFLLQELNLEKLNREGKQEVINILVKNMKTIFRSINIVKINNTNFDSIFKQFQDHSVKQSLTEIKQSKLFTTYSQSASDLKFQRDFTSNPNSGNKYMDRPEASKIVNPTTLNQKVDLIEQKRIEQKSMNDPFSSFGPDTNNYESSLDQIFKPIVDDIEPNTQFNSYSSGRSGDINSKMDEIAQMRQSELSQRNKRPPTPDFLKSKKSNPERNDNSIQSNTSIPQINGNKPDFKNMNSNNFNQSFQGLSNDSGGDLYSLDNIDKPLIETEIVEDQNNFEDRLQQLQSEREGLKANSQQKDVNFTDETFPNSNIGSNSIPKQSENDKRREQMIKQADNDKRREQMIKQAENDKRREQMIKQAENAKIPSLLNSNSSSNNNFSNLKNSMKSINIEVKEDIIQLKQLIDKLYYENTELNKIIKKQNEHLENSKSTELEKIIEIKKQIANEFETLKTKTDDIETKNYTINLKEIELSKKESDVNQLIENYDYLFRTRQIQIEVSDTDNQSKYIWSMDMIPNVTGIKLISYSLPEPKFNIEENKNDLFHIKVNSDDIKIVLPTGKYNIDDLIYDINEELLKLNSNIKLSINKQQKLIISSNDESSIIDIIPTQLSQYNLGFTNQNVSGNSHTANKVWDLRNEEKVYLYLNNLSEEVPFGLLYFNGKSVSQFKFQKPFNMNNLEILFKDSKGNQYNFYDLPHNLSFIIEKLD